MKKLIALFLAIIMPIGLCTACGSNSALSGTTTPKKIIDSEEIVLGYLAESMNKDEVPRGIIVFQAGTALMFEDTDFTMGELSKMTDDKILAALYKEELDYKISSYESDVNSFKHSINSSNESIENCNNRINYFQDQIADLQAKLQEEQAKVEAYNWYDYCVGRKGDFPQTFSDFYKEKQENRWFDLRERDWIEAIWSKVGIEKYAEAPTLLDAWKKYKSDNPNITEIKLTAMNYVSTQNFSVNDERIDEVLEKFDTIRMPDQIERVKTNFEKTKLQYEQEINKVQEDINEVEIRITEYQESITTAEKNIDEKNIEIEALKKLDKLEDRTVYKTIINIQTDSTGNGIDTEYIMLLEKDNIFLGLPLDAKTSGYREENVDVYDSAYYGYSLDMGNSKQEGYLFFKSESRKLKLDFDTLDTKGILIDVTDEKNILNAIK